MSEQFEFTSWSVYTGPSNLKNIIPDPNCPWVVGQWDGVNNDTSATEIKKDIDQRIAAVLNNFQKILPLYKTYNRHFVIPEFFFRCKQGPYPYVKIDGQNYPLEYIQSQMLQKLKEVIPNDNNYYTVVIGSVLTSNVVDYNEFLGSDQVQERLDQLNQLLAGKLNTKNTVNEGKHIPWHRGTEIRNEHLKANPDLNTLNNFMNECRANPFCMVRNRGIYFHFNKTLMQAPEAFVYEKQYESTVDLTMGMFNTQGTIQTGGMITEWMGNYPSYSILYGDKQIKGQYSTNARFTPPFLGKSDVGVEICLDHRLQRLRRTVDMCVANGAKSDNYPLFKQIIPSGGMQILDYSVAADRSCVIFNADGCDKIYYDYTDPDSYILNGNAGIFRGITCGVYTQSIQSKWKGYDGCIYYSHSQLAFCTNGSRVSGFNNALGLNNPKAITYENSSSTPQNILTDSYTPSIMSSEENEGLFAAGMGEIHNYFPKSDE
jgi:hypothetical protein